MSAEVFATVIAVLDADSLPEVAGVATTRYYLVVAVSQSLTSLGVSLLECQVAFADDTLTVADRGAVRVITSYGGNFVVVNRDVVSLENGGVSSLVLPQVGDVFTVQIDLQGHEGAGSKELVEVDAVAGKFATMKVRTELHSWLRCESARRGIYLYVLVEELASNAMEGRKPWETNR